MKKIISLFILILLLSVNKYLAQNVVEVPKTNISSLYTETLNKLDNLRSKPDDAIKLLTGALPQIPNSFERFYFIFWEIPALYCELGKFEEGFDVLKAGQKEGLFYPFIMGQNKFPPYIGNFEKFDDFQSFLDENKKLREAAQQTAKFEYVVQLPKNYSNNKQYPLMIILYGGFGSHTQQMQDWHSPKLDSDYITAYMQGDQCMGSFLRSYPRDNVDQFVTAYNQIISKYSVDTTRVVLGAQSAGAHHSFILMLNERIPVRGMVLAFPGTPQLDLEKVKKAGERGVKVAMLAGEYDPRVIKTKEMAVDMDKQGLKNRFIVSSEKGHEFPDNFPHQIDLSLDFIFN